MIQLLTIIATTFFWSSVFFCWLWFGAKGTCDKLQEIHKKSIEDITEMYEKALNEAYNNINRSLN